MSRAEDRVFSVYLLRCRDGALYCGIAVDVERRITEHESGRRGAKSLRGRGPFELRFSEVVGSRSAALKVEHRIKQLPAAMKHDAGMLQEIVASIRAEENVSTG